MEQPRVAAVMVAWLAIIAVICPVPPAWAQDEGIDLEIIRPFQGDVTDPSTDLIVMAEGGSGETIEFEVAVDGQPVDPETGRPAASGTGTFTVPGEAVRRIRLTGLSVGVHQVEVRGVDPPGVRPAAVAFSVGPKPRSRSVNVPALIIVAVLVAAIYVYRRRILGPRLRRFDRPEGDEGADPEEGRSG